MKAKKENKLMRIVLIVNLVMAVILISSVSYAYYVTKETIADNTITIGTVGVKGLVSNLQVTPEFTVDGGNALITKGSIVISNATPNTQFTFDINLENTSTLNNCYNLIFNSATVGVVDSFSVTAAKAGGTVADNLSFSSLSGRKESNFVVWDASPTDKTRTYNFTLTTGNNPVSGAFNIDIISTQKSAVNYVSDLAALNNTPSGGWAVLSQDIGTVSAPVAAIALTKPLNIDLNGYALYTTGFSMLDPSASGAYTIKNGKVVTTVEGVVVNLPLATLNIADSVFQVPTGKNITITGAKHTVNLSGATSFQRKSGDVYLDIAADIAADTRVIITRSVSKAVGLNVVGGGVVIINESYAEGAITIAAAVASPVTIENNGALARVTNNATAAAAVVAITNNTKATLASVVVSANVTAKVDIINDGILNTVSASNSAELNVVNTNTNSPIDTSGSTNTNATQNAAVDSVEKLNAALASAASTIFVTGDIILTSNTAPVSNYLIEKAVKIVGVGTGTKRPVLTGSITANADLTLENLVVTGSATIADRIMVTAKANFTATNCDFNNNYQGTGDGGASSAIGVMAIEATGATSVKVDNCNFIFSKPTYARGIHVFRRQRCVVEINNTTILFGGNKDNTTTNYDGSRGLCLFGAYDTASAGSYLTADNLTIRGAAYGITSDNDNFAQTINNSKMSGWAVLNCRTTNSTITFNNCELIGTSKYNGPSDNFATLVLDTVSAGNTINVNDTIVESNIAALQPAAVQRILLSRGSGDSVNITGTTKLINNTQNLAMKNTDLAFKYDESKATNRDQWKNCDTFGMIAKITYNSKGATLKLYDNKGVVITTGLSAYTFHYVVDRDDYKGEIALDGCVTTDTTTGLVTIKHTDKKYGVLGLHVKQNGKDVIFVQIATAVTNLVELEKILWQVDPVIFVVQDIVGDANYDGVPKQMIGIIQDNETVTARKITGAFNDVNGVLTKVAIEIVPVN